MSSATWWTAGAGGRRRRRKRRRRAGRRRRRSRRRRSRRRRGRRRGRRGGRWIMRKRVQQPNVMIKVRKKMNIWWNNFKDPVFQMFCDTSKYNQFFKQYILFSIFVKLSKQDWFSVSLSSVSVGIHMYHDRKWAGCKNITAKPAKYHYFHINWRTSTSCQYWVLGEIYNMR